MPPTAGRCGAPEVASARERAPEGRRAARPGTEPRGKPRLFSATTGANVGIHGSSSGELRRAFTAGLSLGGDSAERGRVGFSGICPAPQWRSSSPAMCAPKGPCISRDECAPARGRCNAILVPRCKVSALTMEKSCRGDGKGMRNNSCSKQSACFSFDLSNVSDRIFFFQHLGKKSDRNVA
jgi:hypothetical protein